MVHVGLYSVGTHHKNFGWENKKIKMYFAECLEMTLGKVVFAECPLGVPPIWHSAKHILKLKKNLCRVPDHEHSAKHSYIALVSSSSSSLSHSSCPRRADALTAPPPRSRAHDRRRAHRRALPARDLALSPPRPPCPRPRPPLCPLCPCRPAAPPCPRPPAASPATRRLSRDPPSRP
jgi:hypothetical protein